MKEYLNKFLENGMVLAAVTGIMYFLTYLRLDGVLDAYSLPDELIAIDIADIITTLRDLVYKFWPIIIIPAVGLALTGYLRDANLIRLCRLTVFIITVAAFDTALVGRFDGDNWIVIGICAYEWCEAAVKSILFEKNERGLAAKWKAWSIAKAQKDAQKKAVSGVGWIAAGIAIVYVLSGSMMEHAALNELSREWYFVAQDHEDKLVVFQNDEQYVLMKRDGDEILPEYKIVYFKDIGRLRYEQTGRLALAVPGGE